MLAAKADAEVRNTNQTLEEETNDLFRPVQNVVGFLKRNDFFFIIVEQLHFVPN